MYRRSLALALTVFLLVALVRLPTVSADDTQDKALESLDCWVLANKDEFVVKNVGEVSAQVTSIMYRVEGNEQWEEQDTAELATQKQRKGVKVEITTTNDPSPNHRRALLKLVEAGRRTVGNRKPIVQAGGMVLAFAGVLTFLATLFGRR